ncbi:MAG: hypothetical protein MMC33_004387 [Icmadophila ericetorum]|nr:hypothetical protein [Icmadophila ericetorum]
MSYTKSQGDPETVQPPHIYAELLPNLRHMNIHVTLHHEHNGTEEVELLNDRYTLRVTQDGCTASIDLPARIKEDVTLALSAEKTRQLDWRLGNCHLRQDVNEDAQNGTPWLADSITVDTHTACKSCKTIIAGDGAVRIWKALPSENWAEMMEFWHCHKPIDHNANSDLDAAISSKAYSASNKPRTLPGVGLVGVSNIVLSEEDCSNIKSGEANTIQCNTCSHPLGTHDSIFSGLRLDKWSLSLRRPNCTEWTTYPTEKHLTSLLLSLAESNVVRRFMLYSGKLETATEGLLVWLFNPSIYYSLSSPLPSKNPPEGKPASSLKSKPSPSSPISSQHASTILYHPVVKPSTTVRKHSSEMDELQIPEIVLGEIRKALEGSTEMLPEEKREVRSSVERWRVGVLGRW